MRQRPIKHLLGVLLSDGSRTFEWDRANRLMAVVNGVGTFAGCDFRWLQR